MDQKGVNMFNIRGADTQMVFGSVLDHFTQYGQFLALPEGQNGFFRVKMLPFHEEYPKKAKMTQNWANMLGTIVPCSGRVLSDALNILGPLRGVYAIFSQWPFLDSKIAIFRPLLS